MNKKKAVFLDRDGTVIYDVGYPKDPEEVRLLPWAGEALSTIQKRGFLLIIISNQSGIARGFIAADQAEKVHDRVVLSLTKFGVHIDDSYYCPHMPEDLCGCRKPSPEMILRAAKKHDIDLTESFMIGDKQLDLETSKNAGCHGILLGSKSILVNDDFVANDWMEIEKYIIDRS